MDTEIDNLKKYGTEFQNKCLTSLLTDKLFLERIVDILSPDYFETSAHKWAIKTIVEYFIKYKDIPSSTAMMVKLKEIDDQLKLLKQSAADLLGIAYGHSKDTDLRFIKEQFLEFCKNQSLKTAIIKSVDFLKKGQYESIKNVVDSALRAGMERNLGHNYFEDVDKRMTGVIRDCVKTDWPLIDNLLDGGLGRGELGFIVAPAGSGKSWILTRLGAVAMKQGKNVLHVTLELNEHYVGLRYDAFFTGIPFQNVKNNIHRVKNKIAEVPGKLFIKYFPLKTVSPQSLKLFIERIEMLNQTKIDVLVVDYADILRPFMSERNANSYSDAGSVYEELRGVAGELQIPVWSASQSNRGGHDLDVLQAANVADSYRKIMTGDFIISLSRKMEDKQGNCGRIHVMKNRFGADSMTFPCDFDASNGKVLIFDPNSSEGQRLMQKMKEGEKNLKKHTRDLWEQMMNGDDDSDGDSIIEKI